MSTRTTTCLAIVAAAFLATGLGAGCSNGDSTGPTGSATIAGRLLRVADGARSAVRAGATALGTPVAGAEVIVDGVPSGVFTDAGGAFTLVLDPGTHSIAVNASGANSGSMSVMVDGTTAMTVEFELHADGRLTAHEDVDDDGDLDDDDVNDDIGDDNGTDDGTDDDSDDSSDGDDKK